MSQTTDCQNLLISAANYGSDLIVSVLSTNVLGNGSSSNITIGIVHMNVYLLMSIPAMPEKSIWCIWLAGYEAILLSFHYITIPMALLYYFRIYEYISRSNIQLRHH